MEISQTISLLKHKQTIKIFGYVPSATSSQSDSYGMALDPCSPWLDVFACIFDSPPQQVISEKKMKNKVEEDLLWDQPRQKNRNFMELSLEDPIPTVHFAFDSAAYAVDTPLNAVHGFHQSMKFKPC